MVTVTVAVRFAEVKSAISPTKSPPESVEIRLPPWVTSASPSTITKNSLPMRPSRQSTVPGSTWRSSVAEASVAQLLLRQPLEERRPLERLDLHVLAEQPHA